jgi:hypothetical protein
MGNAPRSERKGGSRGKGEETRERSEKDNAIRTHAQADLDSEEMVGERINLRCVRGLCRGQGRRCLGPGGGSSSGGRNSSFGRRSRCGRDVEVRTHMEDIARGIELEPVGGQITWAGSFGSEAIKNSTCRCYALRR